MARHSINEVVQREAESAVKKQISVILDAISRGDFSGFRNAQKPFDTQTPGDVRKDARDRSYRTLIQQLLIDVVIAVATVAAPSIANLDITSREQWTILGLSVIKTIISAVISYAFRLFYAPEEEGQISLAEAKRDS